MDKEKLGRILGLIKSKENFSEDYFDEMVIDLKCQEASDINNEGFEAQIRFLEACGTDVESLLKPPATRIITMEDKPVSCRECGGALHRDDSPGVWLHDDQDDKDGLVDGLDIDLDHVGIPDET